MPALERAVATAPCRALPLARLQTRRRLFAVTVASALIAFSGKPPNVA